MDPACFFNGERSSWFGHQSLLVLGLSVAGVGESIAGFSLSLPWASGLSVMGNLSEISSGSRAGGRAGGAPAPVDDLGLVDGEAVAVGRGQARCGAGRAVDVLDGSAGPADHVVVVVAD